MRPPVDVRLSEPAETDEHIDRADGAPVGQQCVSDPCHSCFEACHNNVDVTSAVRHGAQQLIDVEIPVDGEALVQDESGQQVDPLAKGPRLDIEPIVTEERLVHRRLGGRA